MKRLNYNFIKYSFEQEGYKLISNEYINAHSLLNFICPEGHEHIISWDNWKHGHRCGKCYFNIFEEMKESFEKENYVLITKKNGINDKYFNFICPNGHKHKIEFRHWKRGVRCSLCPGKITSKGEKEVVDYVKSIYKGSIIENDRTQILNPKTNRFLELDIWLPELNGAIEYGSNFVHNKPKVKIKDEIKKDQCRLKRINLLNINDDIWFKNKTLVKNQIGGFINVLS